MEERVIKQFRENGKSISKNIPLVNGLDTIYFEGFFKDNSPKLFFLTGYKSCESCLDKELSRLKDNSEVKLVVISDFLMEEELRYFWKLNNLKLPLYFTQIENFGLDRDVLSYPSYFLISKDLKIRNLIITEKSDPFEFVDEYFKSIWREFD